MTFCVYSGSLCLKYNFLFENMKQLSVTCAKILELKKKIPFHGTIHLHLLAISKVLHHKKKIQSGNVTSHVMFTSLAI